MRHLAPASFGSRWAAKRFSGYLTGALIGQHSVAVACPIRRDQGCLLVQCRTRQSTRVTPKEGVWK